MNKQHQTAALVCTLAVGMGLILYLSPTPGDEGNSAAIANLKQAAIQNLRAPSADASTERSDRTYEEKQTLVFDLAQALSPSSRDALDAIKAAQNFCQNQSDKNACLQSIGQQLPEPQNKRWDDIRTKLPQLNARLANMPQNAHAPLAERLAVISQARHTILGADDAKLLFGKEEALISYQAALNQFIQSKPVDMPLAQRMQHADALKKQFLGDYQSTPTPQDNYQKYLDALALAKIDAKNDQELADIRLRIRTTYLGAEQAKTMAAQDEWQQNQQQRMRQYQDEKTQILAQYTSQPNAAQQAVELDALRKKWFTTN